MPVGLLGRKIGMTSVYGPEGQYIGVTILEVGPCHVLQLRSTDRDGYQAVQLGFADKLSQADLARDPASRSRSRATRAERGQVVSLSGKNSRLERQLASLRLRRPDASRRSSFESFGQTVKSMAVKSAKC